MTPGREVVARAILCRRHGTTRVDTSRDGAHVDIRREHRQRWVLREGRRRDPDIVVSDRTPRSLQVRPDPCIAARDIRITDEYPVGLEPLLELVMRLGPQPL